jgi:dTDP-4-dehydrorhamnose 3,5-epimerase-like enzyme
MQRATIENCNIVKLPVIQDNRGNLTFVEQNRHIPFDIKRVFYVYDMPTAVDRGAHAHKTLEQFIVCLRGSIEVKVDDGTQTHSFKLQYPWEGLYIPPLIWASQCNSGSGTLYMVMASEYYNEEGYLRDYAEFLKFRQLKKP